jgi:hypothetical protein
MKRTRSATRLAATPAPMEDVVAYLAAQLAVSTNRWHRELGLILGEGLRNRAVFYRFRALVFVKLDAIYANPPARHLPLSSHIVQPWLRARFSTPFRLPSELIRAQCFDSVSCHFLPIRFFTDEIIAHLRTFHGDLKTSNGALLMALWMYHSRPTGNSLRFRACILSVGADVAPTPLLVFMSQCVLQNNNPKDSVRRMLQLTITDRAHSSK